MRQIVYSAIMLILFASCLVRISESEPTVPLPDTYFNARFLDITKGECFYYQVTTNSCVSASVQMVLDYLDYSPLPNQTQLASEMNTDINHTTQWRYASIPFEKRGFHEFLNQSLSSEFDTALNHLKASVCQNYPAIVNTWYDEQTKNEGKITHARVITGYNYTGIFFHDPWSGPSQFMNNQVFADMWKTDLGYWSFIIEKEPLFVLTVQATDLFGSPIPELGLVLKGTLNQTAFTDSNGTARFSNLTMADYVLSYDWRFQSEKINLTLTKSESVNLSLFLSNQVILGIAIIGVVIVVVIALAATIRRRIY